MSEDLDDDLDETTAPGRPGSPVDLTRLIRSIIRRWRVIAVVAVASAALGVTLAQTIAPKTYTSRAVIVWEPNHDQSRQEFGTLIDSMLIPANLNEVKRRLKLTVPLETLALWVQVYFDPESDVVSLEASASSAKGAKDLADTIVAVFFDHCQRLRRARIEAALQELRANLDVARATQTNAQEVYDTFRRENNVTDISAETSLAIQEAATLRSRAEAARGEAQAEAARARLFEENARHERTLVVTSRSQSDPNSAALATAWNDLQQARGRLSSDHPRIAALEAQVQALQNASAGNRQTTTSSGENTRLTAIKTSLAESASARAAAVERQQAYAEHAAEARERLQKLSAVEGQAAILLSEVTNASSHLTDLEARINPLEEALRAVKPDFRVLAPAELPPYPSSGKGKLFAAGVPGASLAVLLIVLIALELRGLRVHTAREAAFWLNAPAVGVSLWPRVPEAFSELLDEVSDCAQNATGNTLIVGAAPGDERAALELANGLRARVEAAVIQRSTDPGYAPRALIGNAAIEGRTTLTEIAPLPASLPPATTAITTTSPAPTTIQLWDTTQKAITLRRASRLSDRVVVVLTADTLAMPRLAALRTQLGREHGIGVLLVGIDPALADLPDRVGDVDGFWQTDEYTDET